MRGGPSSAIVGYRRLTWHHRLAVASTDCGFRCTRPASEVCTRRLSGSGHLAVTLLSRLYAAHADWLKTTHSMVNEVIEPEKEAAIRKIRRLMAFWRISPTELRGRGAPPSRPAPVVAAAARYRHPISGATWGGDGPQPQWLREALLYEGYTVDQLRVRAPYVDEETSSGSCA